MFQRITLIGHVGQEPKMRYTPDGTPVTDISVATKTTLGKSGPNGERPCPAGWRESYNGKNWELTTWWRVTCWRGLAEVVNQYVSKGMQVFVEGEIRGDAADGKQEPRVYQRQDGNYAASFEITARTVKFLGGGSGGSGDGGAPVSEPPPEDDELPF